MKTRFLVAAALAALISFSSCSNDDDKPSKALAKMDIQGATALFIADGGNTRAADGGFFKLNADGTIEEVVFYAGNGKQYSAPVYADWIYPLTGTDYLITSVRVGGTSAMSNAYLLRKSDGALYDIDARIDQRLGGYVNTPYMVKDNSNNFYFSSDYKVFRVDISNPANIVKSSATPMTEGCYDFTVSSTGDVFSSNQENSKVFMKSGGVYNVPNGQIHMNVWRGLDGKIRYINNERAIFTVEVEGNSASIDTFELPFQMMPSAHPAYLLGFSHRILVGYGMYGSFTEVENVDWDTDRLGRSNFTYGLKTIKLAEAIGDNYYYVVGTNSANQDCFLKVNARTDEAVDLVTPGEYTVYSFDASTSGEVTFCAMRMADGKKIIGKISSTGTLQIIDESLNREITALQRLQ